MPLVSDLLSCGLDSRNNQPQPSPSQPTDPVRSAEQSRADQRGQSTRAEVTSNSRSRRHTAAVTGRWGEHSNSHHSRAWPGGHGYSRNSTRSGSIAHLNQSPSHCHPHLVSPCFPICGRSRLSFPPVPLLAAAPAPVTSHNPIPPARQRMRCAVHADRQSLAAGKADRSPPARAPFRR